MIILYGIPNCDACRKARRWLDTHGVRYRFQDLRAAPPGVDRLRKWERELRWETLLNRRSTTWRALPAARKTDLDAARAVALMAEEPTLIKRPVLELDKRHHVGFSEVEYQGLFD
ncbi:MAG: arsenate reductase [Chromatiales bacterium 21-64-14]|nr:MAG: arsenate reductase [Chromatiales bacterium 21-64-14]HQU15151.1 arsenate reductase [Gammaproteobacteria bacterium]